VRPSTLRLPTLDAWNVTVQRQVTATMNVELAYIGNKGTHVFAGTGPAYNTNEAAVGNGTNSLACTAAAGGGFTCAPTSFVPATSQASRRRLFARGISADVGNYFGDDASSSYNAFQAKVEKRFASGFQFMGHYTFAHALAHDGSYYSVDPSVSWGPDPFTRTHVFVVSTVYELPFGRGKRYMGGVSRVGDFVIGGWQISNTLNYSGGLPFTPTIGECGNISDAGPCRPDKGSGSFKLGKTTAANGDVYWFTPVAPLAYPASSATDISGTDSCTLTRPTSGPFVLPACGTVGNFGIYSLRGPRGLFSDMSVSKSFNFTERVKASFRFDAYNVFNHPVLGFNGNQGNLCVDCTGRDPGRVQDIEGDSSPNAPNGMRQLQFGLRFSF